jgi:hypothetical protein
MIYKNNRKIRNVLGNQLFTFVFLCYELFESIHETVKYHYSISGGKT